MAADDALAGIAKYYRRTKTLAELKAIADSCILIATDEVVITSAGIEGATGGGQARTYGKGEILNVLEDLIREMMSAGVSAWTDDEIHEDTRQLIMYAHRGNQPIRT